MLKYEQLKGSFKQFQSRDEHYVQVPREYILEVLDELLRLRRRDAARSHREQVYRSAMRKGLIKT